MVTTNAEFRLTVYEDEAMSTPLTPPSGAPHSDAFKVATLKGITGFKPYLYYPKGRRASMDPKRAKTDVPKMTAELLDKRTTEGGTNLERWVTAFVGNAQGEPNLGGRRARWEISTDGGSSWSDYWTGRLKRPGLQGRTKFRLEMRGAAAELDGKEVFVGRPHNSVSYAFMAPVWPLGLVESWAGVGGLQKMPGTAHIGGSKYENRIEIDESALDGDLAERNVVTQTLKDELLNLFERVGIGSGPASPVSGLRVLIDNNTTGNSGELAVTRGKLMSRVPSGGFSGHVAMRESDAGHQQVAAIGITEVDSGHPNHIALPSDGDDVDVAIVADREPDEKTPLFIKRVHPAKLLRDILDGKFGHLNADGSVQWSIARDSTAQGTLREGRGKAEGFANLIADDTFHQFRGNVKESMELREAVESPIGAVHRIGARWKPNGEYVPVDLRLPEDDANLTTLGNSDVNIQGEAPSWHHSRQDAVTLVNIRHYVDEVLGRKDYEFEEQYPDISSSLIKSRELTARVLDVGDPSLGVKEETFDAIGFRVLASEAVRKDEKAARLQLSEMREMAESLRRPYARGPEYASIPTRRTSTVEAITVGQPIVVDVDELPDPATAKRGGARVCRVTGKRDDGPQEKLDVVDLFDRTTANAPSLADPTTQASPNDWFFVNQDVTLNADGDPAIVQIALTPTTQTSRPAEASNLWHTVGRVTGAGGSTSTVEIEAPAGKRVWTRARSVPQDKAPSSWAYPTAESTDTVDLPSVSSASVTNISGSTALGTWTVGDPNLDVVVEVRNTTNSETHIPPQALEPGTEEYLIRQLTSGDSYALDIYHRGPNREEGPITTVTFTAGNTNDTSPRLRGLGILYGRLDQLGARDLNTEDRKSGIAVYVKPRDASLEVELEIAPDDGSGNPDTANSSSTTIAPGKMVHTFELPRDGTHRFIRGRHNETGQDPSDWTSWHEARPLPLPAVFGDVPDEPLVAADVSVDTNGNVSFDLDGAPAVRSYRYEIQTGSFADPDSSSTLIQADSEGDASDDNVASINSGERAYLSVDVYESPDGSGTPVASVRDSELYSPDTNTQAGTSIRIRNTLNGDGTADVWAQVNLAPSVEGGTLKLWFDDPTGTEDASFSNVQDGDEYGPTDDAALNNVNIPPSKTRQVWARYGFVGTGEEFFWMVHSIGEGREIVQVDHEESDTTGTLKITANDPENDLDIDFLTKTSRSASWTSAGSHSSVASGSTVSETIDPLPEAPQKAFIAADVYYAGTNVRAVSRIVMPFDSGSIPNAVIESVTFDPANGSGRFSYDGDSDQANVRWTAQLNSDPADPGSGSSQATGRSGVVDTGLDASLNDVLHVKVRGEDSNGNLGPVKKAEAERHGKPTADKTKEQWAGPASWTPIGTTDFDVLPDQEYMHPTVQGTNLYFVNKLQLPPSAQVQKLYYEYEFVSADVEYEIEFWVGGVSQGSANLTPTSSHSRTLVTISSAFGFGNGNFVAELRLLTKSGASAADHCRHYRIGCEYVMGNSVDNTI